jgi:hypothetical protein
MDELTYGTALVKTNLTFGVVPWQGNNFISVPYALSKNSTPMTVPKCNGFCFDSIESHRPMKLFPHHELGHGKGGYRLDLMIGEDTTGQCSIQLIDVGSFCVLEMGPSPISVLHNEMDWAIILKGQVTSRQAGMLVWGREKDVVKEVFLYHLKDGTKVREWKAGEWSKGSILELL